jgi:hypothetical protein
VVETRLVDLELVAFELGFRFPDIERHPVGGVAVDREPRARGIVVNHLTHRIAQQLEKGSHELHRPIQV